MPTYMFWKCYARNELLSLVGEQHQWILIVWWLSLLWVTRHMWFPNADRLAKTER